MKLTAYKVSEAMEIRPASPSRKWMDESINKNPYRCLPLTMANSYGWELISKSEAVAEWNGGPYPSDVKIENVSGSCFPSSHFGEGVITWHTGYLFTTEYPYGLYVTGSPNQPINNIICLSGIVETFWLPFTFTMNWRFTQPGKVTIKVGDVISHIFPVRMDAFQDLQPELRNINDNPELKQKYQDWSSDRSKFLKGHREKGDWQKTYFKGVDLLGNKEENHKTNPNVPNFSDHTK
jgi:hypothetical protein